MVGGYGGDKLRARGLLVEIFEDTVEQSGHNIKCGFGSSSPDEKIDVVLQCAKRLEAKELGVQTDQLSDCRSEDRNCDVALSDRAHEKYFPAFSGSFR